MKMDMLRDMNQSAMQTGKTQTKQTTSAIQSTQATQTKQPAPLSEQEIMEMRLALLNQQEKAKLQNNQELLRTLQGLKKNFTEIDSDLKKLSNAIQGFHANALQNYQRTVLIPMEASEKVAKRTQDVLESIQQESANISTSWNTSIYLTAFVASFSASMITSFLFIVLPKLLGR